MWIHCGCRAEDYCPPEVYVAMVVIKMMCRPLACAVTSTTSAHTGSDAALRGVFVYELISPTLCDAATKDAGKKS